MSSTLMKHLQVLITSWRIETDRRKTAKPLRETAFQPAALEIMESPPSPIGRATMWVVTLFLVFAVTWASLGRVDIVAVASGQLAPQGSTTLVQSPLSGTIQALNVQDGSQVKRGDILIMLDATGASADLSQAQERLRVAELAVTRNKALLTYTETGSSDIDTDVGREPLTRREQSLIGSLIAEFEAQQAALMQQKEERLADRNMAQSQIEKLQATLPLVREQLKAQEDLLSKGFAPRLKVLESRERLISMEADLEIAQDEMHQSNAAIEEVLREGSRAKQAFRKKTLTDLDEAEAQVRLARDAVTKSEEQLELHMLKAPISGTVQELSVHSAGEIVDPSERLMVLVPGDSELIVEAKILNRDIGFIQESDATEVKLEAFPFTKYGVIDGVIESISSSAVQDQQQGLVYLARIRLDQQTIEADGKTVQLVSGMVATAEIKTGKRRIIEFLLSPLLRYNQEALRER